MLQRIGFFHFGCDHTTPIPSLERSLCMSPGARDALIVLPEAFNIGTPYRGPGERKFDRTVLKDLEDLAAWFHVAFVAGLIVTEVGGPIPPRSAAYLVDGSSSRLMGYKVGADDTVGTNYTPCDGKGDFDNPIVYGGVRVGALICVDANPLRSTDGTPESRLKTVVDSSDVVCVPAHMGNDRFGGGRVGDKAALVQPWNNKRLILANSKDDGIQSFMTDIGGRIINPTVGGAMNKVITVSTE